MTFRTIHTLEARGNILLEIVKDRSGASDSAMRRLIWWAAEELTQTLTQRGVNYPELKSALVPQIDKAEIALLFDRASIDSAAYGWQVHARVVPLLSPTGSHSVLHGDLGTEAASDDWVQTALQIHLLRSGNPFRLIDSNQIFCLYLNNVSAHLRRTLHDSLAAAYLELVSEFERATGHPVSTVRGASIGTTPNSIPSRLQRGEPVDVVVMNGNALDGLVKDGKIAAGTRVDLGGTSVGVAVRAGSPKPDIGSVDAFKRAMRSAKSIAYASNGRTYLFTELFPRLGIADQVEGKSLMVEGAADAVGTAVARGEAEIGLHIISELLPVPGIDVVGPLPAEIKRIAPLGRRAVFSTGIVVGAKEPDAASALIKFLASPAAAPVITKSGLEPLAR